MDGRNLRRAAGSRGGGFTLVELLVVIGILALLAALLVPAAGRALAMGARGKCAQNLMQLQKANTIHADDKEFFAAAAADIWGRNLQRWYGTRSRQSAPFGTAGGPLSAYLGGDRLVRACPSLKNVQPGFEAGCGGYGYNQWGVGSQAYLAGSFAGAPRGMKPDAIANPSWVVMFSDAAFLDGSVNGLIEYSFAESFFSPGETVPVSAMTPATPSIHFRHCERAGVVWCDGHVSWEEMTTASSEVYRQNMLGWFGGPDNALFAPF